MNLSHYQPLAPEMDGRHGQKRREAGFEPLPADDPTAVLFLTPGTRPLGVEAGHVSRDRSPSWGLGLPDPLGHRGPDAPSAELPAQRLRVRALVGHDALQACPGAPPRAGPKADRVQPGEHRSALVAVRRCRASGQGHSRARCQAVAKEPCPFAAPGHPLTAACARGTRNRRHAQTASESGHVPQRCRGAAPASVRGSHRPASAATTGAPSSSRPIGGRRGRRTSGSR